MNNKKQVLKKVVATTLAANVLSSNIGALNSENVASAWWLWNSHTQEEVDSIYDDITRLLDKNRKLLTSLDDTEKAQEFLECASNLEDEQASKEKTYNNAVAIQKKAKKWQNDLALALDLQDIERRKKAEEAAEEEARIEREHKRKLEEQRLQLEKEERDRLEQVNNAKAILSEKVSSIMRKAVANLELQENVDRISSISTEIEEKIQAVDNLNRVEGIETLIGELQTEIDSALSMEADLRKKALEQKFKEEKVALLAKNEELSDLVAKLYIDESLNKEVQSFKETVINSENLDEIFELQRFADDLQARIVSLIELQTQKEAERKAKEDLERYLESLRDADRQCEMLSEGKIKLDDVIGGNQKAKSKALTFIKAFEKYSKGGKFEPSKGLLLYGPPGTGKTSFVKALAAEQGIELFIITPSLVMGDGGERKVLEIIEQAKKAAQISGKQVILLIDEIDAVAQKRSSSNSDKVLVMLMNEIDKLKPSDNVMIFATTNRREALDSAIIRSGRLDQSVEVGLPNAEAKEEILNIYLKHFKHDDLSLKAFIDKMRGFCGADIRRVVDIAINSAMERQGVENLCEVILVNEDFQHGVATVMDEKVTVY